MSPPVSCLKTDPVRLRLRLRPAAEARVRSGHPWVFSDSIREQNREGVTGELAVIFDRQDKFLALGFYDAASPIRVRIFHRGKPVQIDEAWWRERLRESIQKREGILDSNTNACRMVNGESDGFPALVIDRYAESAVVKLYSAIWFSRVHQIVELANDLLQPVRVILRLSRNIQGAAAGYHLHDGQILSGTGPSGPIEFLESGLRFEANLLKGQKTGFFLDQRENRRAVETLARGRRVLNAFSFAGGFSLYAARGGAVSAMDVDISGHALESSRRNFALNRDAAGGCEHRLVQADVFEWIERARESFNLLILDPPSLAKKQADAAGALEAYGKLARAALRLASAQAILVCCSCSAHVRGDEFFGAIEKAVRLSGRRFQVLRRTREPLDHHASFAEAEYLKAIYLELE